jgi:hypothetical protein
MHSKISRSIQSSFFIYIKKIVESVESNIDRNIGSAAIFNNSNNRCIDTVNPFFHLIGLSGKPISKIFGLTMCASYNIAAISDFVLHVTDLIVFVSEAS